MKWEIIADDREKLKDLLNKFIVMSSEEYEKEKTEWEGKDLPMGIKVPNLPDITFGYYEKGEGVVFYSTFTVPRFLKWTLKPMIAKTEKMLTGYFQENGIKIKSIKYLGD
jgi:hypothetical protein